MFMLFRLALIALVGLALTSLLEARQTPADTLKELHRRIDLLTEEIEQMKLGEVGERRYEAQRGLGPAASKVYQLKKTGVSIAGYGELVYENYSAEREDGAASNRKDKFDYLRNVLYVGFRFNDWIVFNSEIEVEHASTGKGGEVSMEFGYVDLMFSNALNVRAGMVLSPVGIVNEKHEPSTFFGTLRPQVERSIIPSTWRANGIGMYGELGSSFDYRIYLVEGFNAAVFSDADGVRGGRQNGANSVTEDFGVTGKVNFTGVPGTIVGASFYRGNSGQGATDSLGTIDAATTLVSVHGEFAWKGLEMRVLYAQATLDEAGRVSRLVKRTIGSKMNGWYVVAGYDIVPLLSPGSDQYLAPFIQYEQLNTHAEVASGFVANKAFDRSTLTVGLTYKPYPTVAFKFDYRDNKTAAATGIPQWNLALNYLF